MDEETGRCGRRKQRNPRRKNELTDVQSQVEGEPGTEDQDTTLDGDSDTQPESSTQSDVDSCHDNKDETNNQTDMNQDTNSQASTIVNSPEESSVAKDDLEENKKEENGYHDNMKNGYHTNQIQEHGFSEEDRIQELMNRSDTAVIFPEPVSDQEDNSAPHDNNNDEGNSTDGEYVLKCPHCDKGCTRVYLLREHIQSAHPEKGEKHICSKCGASFVLKTQLEKHLALHSPASQVCKICHKTFANVYRLQRHMISHDESSDLRKFKCPECGKAFKFKHHLKEHIRIHSGEKPFECSNCGKRFSHSGSYSSHMTSKKCWVVNLKMRKPDAKPTDRAEETLRPLVPKVDENGVDMNVTSLYANQFAHQFIPFDPTGGHLSAQYIAAHLNGTRPPFLPFGAFNPGHMINPMIPGLPASAYGFPVIGDKKEQNHEAKLKESGHNATVDSSPAPKVPENNDKSDKPITDENQNSQSVPDSHEKSQVSESKENGEEKESEVKEEKEDEEENADVKPDMAAVKKILEIVDATVSQQQMTKDDKTAISKLTQAEEDAEKTEEEEDAEKKKEDEEEKSEVENGATDHTCRHCKEQFTSPVDLHQHERYLCKWNQEIPAAVRNSHSSPVVPNGVPPTAAAAAAAAAVPVPENQIKVEHEDDNTSDTSSIDREGRQYHVRSWFSEEQRSILKGHYKANPRPDKYELTAIASQLGLPKRVVQVWFQNTRAQDRRKGIVIPPISKNSDSKVTNGQTGYNVKVSSTYIPVVPQVTFNGIMSHNSSLPFYTTSNKTTSDSVSNSSQNSPSISSSTFSPQMEPLDLSVRKRPSGGEEEGEVLNLSQKSSRAQSEEKKFEESAIFKYMQQEGLITHGRSGTPLQQPLMVLTGSRGNTPVPRGTPEHCGSPRHTPDRPLVITSTPLHRGSPLLLPPASSPSTSELASPPSSLESSFNSTLSLDSAGMEGLNGFLGKAKRARKKSWRQVESEEGQLELDDALMIDEDQPNRKKRKSWKAHKVDAEEGLYACDECDKVFNKQSSLARHKYEHSGQRPYCCDICTKAFKHKHHLTEHKRLHSGEKPFQCKKCGKRFSHSGSFSQHMNHRYKYCKPNGNKSGDEENEMEDEIHEEMREEIREEI